MTVNPMIYNVNTRVRWAAVERTLKGIDLTGKHVLDVGCGLGFFSERFLERGATIEGIDVDAAAVKFVRERTGAVTRIFNIETEPLPRSSYDIIFAGEVLEHLKDPGKFYVKAQNALRPGGHLIVTTPALEGWLSLSRGKQLAHSHGGQKHEREGFRAAELNQFARTAGLTEVSHGYCLHTLAELFMQLTKLGYLLSRCGYEGQSDVLGLVNKPSFQLLRLAFSLIWPMVLLEDSIARLLGARGHCHVHITQQH